VKHGLMHWWTIPDRPPARPECLVIPSYALKDRGLPTMPTRAQLGMAFTWWQRFPETKLIMCTGDNQGLGISNARVMANYAVGLGVPRANIVEEDRSLTTVENLSNAMEIISTEGLAQPTLITLDLYTRRAVATAWKLGWHDFYWVSVYSPGEPAHGYKWLQTHSRPTIFCYEVLAMVYSRLVGWV